VLQTGRRYAVVGSGVGVTARQEPGPSARPVASYGFASVVATTAETSGADGRVWRRVESSGWAPRESLLVFGSVGDAAELATELRVFAPRELRAAIQSRDAPGAHRATATPGARPAATAPTATPGRSATPPGRSATPPERSGAVPEPLYGVVVRPTTRLSQTAGGQPVDRPPLQPGAVVAILDQAIGTDGQPWLRLESNLWLAADRVAVHATAAEAAAVAYDVTMEWLAPGVEIHPDVAPALWLLRREAELRYLAEAIRDGRVPIRVDKLPESGPVATYSFRDRTITFADRALGIDVRALAAFLAHEATHAWEHARGLVLEPGAPCFEAELRAFRNQARLWEIFHGPNGKPQPGGQAERELNEIVQLLKQEPEQLKLRLVRLYGDQCGYHGPRPALPGATTATPASIPAATPATKPPATPPPKPAAPKA
jgi:hypothetical protein